MKHPVARLKYCAQSDIGLVRSCNEDAYAIGGGQSDEYPGSLFVVCDGMGGQSAGEVAAHLATDTIIEAYYSSKNPDRGAALIEAFQQANQQVYQQLLGAGRAGTTTAVAALVVAGKALIVNAGDSRAYRARDGYLHQISEDHTYSEKLVREGILTREQLHAGVTHRVLYHEIGIPEKYFKADLFQELLQEGDLSLLCTDGLEAVENSEIERTIREQPLENVVSRLVYLANARGGYDNVTAILIWPEE